MAVIDDYELLEKLGQGGMGEVYRAVHRSLGREAAVKVILSDPSATKERRNAVERFEREARATARLRSPHTIEVYDFGRTEDGDLYYAMELLEGCNLQNLVRFNGPLTADRAVALLRQACESLTEAHENGLIHRDIKPGNLFICKLGARYDFLKLLDFGLVGFTDAHASSDAAPLTRADAVEGTPAYMPPECINGTTLFDERSDLYALGCVAYWLLTGQLVFEGENPMQTVLAHVREEPTPPSQRTEMEIPADLEAIVMKCLSKSPKDRPAGARALWRMLDDCSVARGWTDRHAEAWWRLHRPELWVDELDDDAPRDRAREREDRLSTPGARRPTVVVLPFDDLSPGRDQDWFGDGMTEDIITDLSKRKDLFIIARHTAFTYKGTSESVREVGRALGVDHVVLGSVRRAGERVRVAVQLVDAETERTVWAERYDREVADIFGVQDEVSQKIVQALVSRLSGADPDSGGHSWEPRLEAYEMLVKGRERWWAHTKDAVLESKDLFEGALSLEPDYALAMAYLGEVHSICHINQWGDAAIQDIAVAAKCVERAYELSPDDPVVLACLATVLLFQRKHDRAVAMGLRSIEIAPNLAFGQLCFGWCQMYSGNGEAALAAYGRCTRLDPYFPDIQLHMRAQAEFLLERYEEAIGHLKQRIVRTPETDISRVLLASCYGHVGRHDEARAMYAEALRVNPEYSFEHRRRILPYRNPQHLEQMVDGLRKAGVVQH